MTPGRTLPMPSSRPARPLIALTLPKFYVEGKFTLPADPVPWAGVVLMVLAAVMLLEAIRVIASLGGPSEPQPEFAGKPAVAGS